MSIRAFRAAALIAYSALIAFGQRSEETPDSAASSFSQTAETANPASHSDAILATFNPAAVANCSLCSGLVSSTGNLYFTSYTFNDLGPDSTAFYRTGKTSLPGSEGLLYREEGDKTGPYFFGSVVWAKPDTFYGYFVANYIDFGFRISQIKRVPLAGGGAITLANSPGYIGNRDLLTDGTRLFWVDAGGIRSLSIYGGAIQTLLVSSSVSRISLDPNFVYYAEGNQISRVPKAGGAPLALFVAPKVVTALYADPRPSFTYIFWGEKGGAVRSAAPGFSAWTWQGPVAGRDVTSVGFDGTYALWIDCTQPGNSYCSVRMGTPGNTATVAGGGVGAHNLQWDARNVFWINLSNVMRYSH